MKNLIKNDFTFIDIIKDNQEIIIENKDNNTIIQPNNTVCYDEADPYLVVAADKGTATFSDIANKICYAPCG